MHLHLHGQSRWHDDITIIGNREALTRLRSLIDATLTQDAVNGISSASSETNKNDACFFTNDGEGYFADVVLLEDSDERWKALKLPYTDFEMIRPQDNDLVWNARKQDFERLDTYGSVVNSMRNTMQAKIGDWLLTGNTGVSSETMAAMALGSNTPSGDGPHDTGDFSRCVKLVHAVPEVLEALKMRMRMEGTLPVPKFVPLIIHWNKLLELFKAVWGENFEKNPPYDEFRKVPAYKHLLEMITLINEGKVKAEDDLYAMAVQSVAERDDRLYAQKKAKQEAAAKAKAEYDALPAIKKRPKLEDCAIVAEGVNAFVDANPSKWGQYRADLIDWMVKNWNHQSAYELAKAMERDGWTISENDLDEIGLVYDHISDAHKKAQIDWLSRNKITAPFPAGTYVKFKHGRQELTGVIKEREAYSSRFGQYVIAVDEQFNYGKGCPIVNWEDVEACE